MPLSFCVRLRILLLLMSSLVLLSVSANGNGPSSSKIITRKDYKPRNYSGGVDGNPFAYQGPYGFEDKFRSESFSFDQFRGLIEGNSKVRKIEDALALLPEEYRKDFALIYFSRSLQEASYQEPRVVAYGGNASFIVAYNGSVQQKGGDRIEMIQFRRESRSFEFRELKFFADGSKPEFSEANPAICLKCHQSASREDVDPRPNWEPYNFWPGVYASDDKNLAPFKKGDDIVAVMEEQDRFIIDLQKRENKELEKFYRGAKKSNPRYKNLGNYNVRSPLEITEFLGRYNAKRVERLVEQTPFFEYYKFAIAGVDRCREEGLVLPRELFEKHENFFGAPLNQEGINKFYLRMKYLFEPLGIDISDWPMTFGTGGKFAFADSFGNPNQPTTSFFSDFRREFIFEILNKNFPNQRIHQNICNKLMEMAETELLRNDVFQRIQLLIDENHRRKIDREEKRIWLKKNSTAKERSERLLARCVECHSTTLEAPMILFENENWLRENLLGPEKYSRGNLLSEIKFRMSKYSPFNLSMPRQQTPNNSKAFENEKKDLIAYLESLVSNE